MVDRVCVGRIIAAHGVRGAVRLISHTEEPAALAGYNPLSDAQGRRRFVVHLIGQHRNGWLATVEGVTSRTAAEALAGTDLWVERARLPTLEEDEVYLADLIGLRVERQEGTTLGTIRAVPDYGGGPMLVIAGTDGHELLIPFTLAAVPVIDLPAGRVVVDPPQEVAGEEGETEAVLEEAREGGSS